MPQKQILAVNSFVGVLLAFVLVLPSCKQRHTDESGLRQSPQGSQDGSNGTIINLSDNDMHVSIGPGDVAQFSSMFRRDAYPLDLDPTTVEKVWLTDDKRFLITCSGPNPKNPPAGDTFGFSGPACSMRVPLGNSRFFKSNRRGNVVGARMNATATSNFVGIFKMPARGNLTQWLSSDGIFRIKCGKNCDFFANLQASDLPYIIRKPRNGPYTFTFTPAAAGKLSNVIKPSNNRRAFSTSDGLLRIICRSQKSCVATATPVPARFNPPPGSKRPSISFMQNTTYQRYSIVNPDDSRRLYHTLINIQPRPDPLAFGDEENPALLKRFEAGGKPAAKSQSDLQLGFGSDGPTYKFAINCTESRGPRDFSPQSPTVTSYACFIDFYLR